MEIIFAHPQDMCSSVYHLLVFLCTPTVLLEMTQLLIICKQTTFYIFLIDLRFSLALLFSSYLHDQLRALFCAWTNTETTNI